MTAVIVIIVFLLVVVPMLYWIGSGIARSVRRSED
jgi:hypothetical protein